mmetsp:Transcript_20264/g.49695  ORF Transcript_20264/g.49695 Transcript_20264/m.49695 type:complete len:194 (-) Transcript_20264:164-745(-)|eukprot:CAMPEP_0113638416 /NCGR_PEP_ID=MMETSP0017_2-20120614/20123_1 /TAXON_ID=2856 /ORGANISM="Cylindrotheca closterium" /LENGTH=193 /DNA_ID=CAMNT_0000549519 /DNA_START=112 /DNA_END=693 /DNA_ORIENTATION=+ /assembly_acc=CAM_ASM_000147
MVVKLPKGVGELPDWWMELCPHNVYESPEETARMQAAYEESQIFSRVPENFKQDYGGDDFPNWNPAEHGPMGDEMTKDWETKGYKRDPASNKWVGKDGKPLEGRQFSIKPPKGYTPGAFGGGGGGRSPYGKGGLKSPGGGGGGGGYANDKTSWEKPAWTTKKLRSTAKTPPAKSPAGGPTKNPGKIAKPAWAK